MKGYFQNVSIIHVHIIPLTLKYYILLLDLIENYKLGNINVEDKAVVNSIYRNFRNETLVVTTN